MGFALPLRGWVQYVQAIVLSGSAYLIAFVIEPVLDPNMTLPFLGAVALSAWIGGIRGGLAATLLCTFGFYYGFLPPRFEFKLEDYRTFVRLAGLVTIELLVISLIWAVQKKEASVAAAEERYRRKAQELEAVNRELNRSNEELEQFAYVASHDLQEPLRMVASFTELLGAKYTGKLDSDADEYIHFAVDGARRMQQLINDLLRFSRAGRADLQIEPIDLGRILDQVLHGMALSIEEAGAEITRDPMPVVRADRKQMQQLLQNLIGNSLKFRRNDPLRIHIAAVPGDSHWTIEVADNGIGFDPKYKDRVFVMFQRLQGREEYPGTGIGLAICRKIVDRHGGRIGVDSRPGEGSTFWFTIPDNRINASARSDRDPAG